MAVYTESIRELLQDQYPDVDFSDVDNIIQCSKEYIFNGAENVLSPEYRDNFVAGFTLHFFNDEIGLETFPLWKIALYEKLFNNSSYIDGIYSNLDKQIFTEYEVVHSATTGSHSVSGNTSGEETGSTSDTKTGTDRTTHTGTDTVNSTASGTTSNTMNSTERNLVSESGNETKTGRSTLDDTINGTKSGTEHSENSTTGRETTGIDTSETKTHNSTTTTQAHGSTTNDGTTNVSGTDETNSTQNVTTSETPLPVTVSYGDSSSVSGYSDTPQNGISASDVTGMNTSGGAWSFSDGSKYLTNASSGLNKTKSVTEVGASYDPVTGSITHGSITGSNSTTNHSEGEKNETTTVNNATTSTDSGSSIVEDRDTLEGSNDTEKSSLSSVTVNGTSGETNKETKTSLGTTSDTNVKTNSTDGSVTGHEENNGRTSDTSQSTNTKNLVDTVTLNENNQGSSSKTNTGTSSETGTNSGSEDITKYKTTWEVLFRSMSLLNNVWEVFNDIFMAIY